MIPSIADLWADFSHRYAKETGEQLNEVDEFAFYAGAESVLAAIKKEVEARMGEVLLLARRKPRRGR